MICLRLCLVPLGIAIAYWQFRDWLDDWIPAIGSLDTGHGAVQIVFIGLAAAIAFWFVVSLGYQILGEILD